MLETWENMEELPPDPLKKTQRHHWLNERLPSLDSLCGRAPPPHPKITAQRKKHEEVVPLPSFRREVLRCLTAQDAPVRTTALWRGREMEARFGHCCPKAGPESLLPLASACPVSPHGLHGQFRYPNWSCEGQTQKAGARPRVTKFKAVLLP